MADALCKKASRTATQQNLLMRQPHLSRKISANIDDQITDIQVKDYTEMHQIRFSGIRLIARIEWPEVLWLVPIAKISFRPGK
jgi:hypothetical protein